MACLLDRQGTVNLHRTFDTLLKRRRDVDTDMRDVVVCHDGISASSQNNKIFLLRHVNQKVALVEEDRITLRQSVKTAELAHTLAQGQMALRDECLTRVYIGILIVRRLFLDSRLDSVAIVVGAVNMWNSPDSPENTGVQTPFEWLKRLCKTVRNRLDNF